MRFDLDFERTSLNAVREHTRGVKEAARGEAVLVTGDDGLGQVGCD